MKDMFMAVYKTYIKRPGADELLAFLEKSDFFTAPASTKYHLAKPGGLLEHSINVYNRLRDLYIHEKEYKREDCAELTEAEEETIAICGLLHDLCKVCFYVQEKKSRKTGKILPNGKPEWEDYIGYSINDTLPYGHGEKSVYIINGYLRLSREEAIAIRFHMGPWSTEDTKTIGAAYEKYPLALMLHLADMMASKIDENEEKENA